MSTGYTLRTPECPNVRNYKCRLDLDGTEHFVKCNHLTPLSFKGLMNTNLHKI